MSPVGILGNFVRKRRRDRGDVQDGMSNAVSSLKNLYRFAAYPPSSFLLNSLPCNPARDARTWAKS